MEYIKFHNTNPDAGLGEGSHLWMKLADQRLVHNMCATIAGNIKTIVRRGFMRVLTIHVEWELRRRFANLQDSTMPKRLLALVAGSVAKFGMGRKGKLVKYKSEGHVLSTAKPIDPSWLRSMFDAQPHCWIDAAQLKALLKKDVHLNDVRKLLIDIGYYTTARGSAV